LTWAFIAYRAHKSTFFGDARPWLRVLARLYRPPSGPAANRWTADGPVGNSGGNKALRANAAHSASVVAARSGSLRDSPAIPRVHVQDLGRSR
jgi:hypothetical protein